MSKHIEVLDSTNKIVHVIRIADSADPMDFVPENGSFVDISPEVVIPSSLDERRAYRSKVFSNTLDKLNPLWYNLLTEQQKLDLAEWRQAWLDYPSTGVIPEDLSFL